MFAISEIDNLNWYAELGVNIASIMHNFKYSSMMIPRKYEPPIQYSRLTILALQQLTYDQQLYTITEHFLILTRESAN